MVKLETQDIELDANDVSNIDVEDQMLAALQASPGDISWKVVVHLIEPDGTEARIGSFPPTDIDGLQDKLSAQYGTGNYKFRLYKNGRIAYQKTNKLIAPKVPTAATPMLTPGNDMGQAFAAAMKEQTTLLAGLIERIGNGTGGGGYRGPSMMDMVNAMASLKTLNGPSEGGLSAEKAIDLVMKGMEIARETGSGGGGGETGFMDILREIVKPFASAMASGQLSLPGIGAANGQPIAIPHSTMVQTPANTGAGVGGTDIHKVDGAVANAQTATTDQAAQAQATQFLRQQFAYLTAKAAANADVELYAEWVCDNIPMDALSAIVMRPDAMQLIQSFAPEMQPYTGWFTQLLQIVREILTERAAPPTMAQPPQPPGSQPSGVSTAPTADTKPNT